MKTIWFYLFVVAMIAIPLALFERWGIAHFKVGWGEPLPPDTIWGKQVFQGSVLLTRYHFVMFGIIVPLTLLAVALAFKSLAAHPPATIFAWILFMVACILGVMELEDFLFFIFSSIFHSPYSHALARFFRGEATWHKGWINFGYFKLPAFYVAFPIIIYFLLWWEARVKSI